MLRWLDGARRIPLMNADGGAGGGSGAGAGEGGAGSGSGEGSGGGEGSGAGDGKSGGEEMVPKSEVQKQIDAAVKDRLAREKKKTDGVLQKLQAQIDELSGKAPAGGGEGAGGQGEAGAAAEAAKAEAAKILEQANRKVLEATAVTESIKLGIDPKYAADAVKLADLSTAMKEDGTVDEKAVAKALDDVLKRIPAFKAQSGEGQGGFRVGGEGGKPPAGNGWGQRQQQQGSGDANAKRWNRWR